MASADPALVRVDVAVFTHPASMAAVKLSPDELDGPKDSAIYSANLEDSRHGGLFPGGGGRGCRRRAGWLRDGWYGNPTKSLPRPDPPVLEKCDTPPQMPRRES